MVDIHDYDIQCIEHEILWKYDKSPCGEIGAFPPSLGRRNPPIQS